MEVFFENKFKKTNLLNSYSDSGTDSEDLEETVYVKSDNFQLKKYEYNQESKNLFLEESYISFSLIYDNLNYFFFKIQRIFSIEEIEKFLSQLLFNNKRDFEIETYQHLRYRVFQDQMSYSYIDSLEFDDNSREVMFNNKIKLNIIAYYDIEGPILYYSNN